MKINVKIFFLPFLILFMISCSLRTAKVSGPVETPAETEVSIPLLTNLNGYNDRVDTVEGNALTVYREEGSTISLKTEIVSDKNGQNFRIDLSDYVFKVPLVSIVKNNNDILAVVYNKKEYYKLTFNYFNFHEMTGINVPKEILVSSMTGNVYLIEGETAVSSPEDDLLSIEGRTGRELVRFNGESLPIEAQYIDETDIYTVRYEKYKKIDNIDYPHRIIIKHQDSQLEINYTDIKLNGSLDSSVFEFDRFDLNEYRKVD